MDKKLLFVKYYLLAVSFDIENDDGYTYKGGKLFYPLRKNIIDGNIKIVCNCNVKKTILHLLSIVDDLDLEMIKCGYLISKYCNVDVEKTIYRFNTSQYKFVYSDVSDIDLSTENFDELD